MFMSTLVSAVMLLKFLKSNVNSLLEDNIYNLNNVLGPVRI
jgi:hypothetical protein